jgi:hypothetical protein
MASGLMLAYPMLEGGGSIAKNYGGWGSSANLTLSNASWTKRETGMASLSFSAANAVAKNTLMARTIPGNWSWAAWIKLDSTPTSTPKDLFSFRTSSGVQQVRVWADSTGLWSWQKSATADNYSVLSPSYFPTSGPVLIISTFAGNNLAPVQMVTNTGMRSIPTQPISYAAFNVGQGAQATTLDGFYLGNDHQDTAPWDGNIGPFYFWNRVLTNSEVWELWQDPYAPFRRNSANFYAPMTMRASSGYAFTGVGKTSGPKTIIQDQNSLFITVEDDYFYQNSPIDTYIEFENNLITLNISDDYAYVSSPVDTLSPPEFLNIIISLTDSYTYTIEATDAVIEGAAPNAPVISINDDYSYQDFITDNLVTSITQGPLNIGIDDEFQYSPPPTDTATSP